MDIVRELQAHPLDLRKFCERWKISRLELFGSCLRGDYWPDSDMDFLVTFEPDAKWSLSHFVHMQEELSGLVGRPVDLSTRRSIEQSQNWIRREEILETARDVIVR